eukprot:1590684-Pyramimonas_sp.AAC.1
MQPARPRGRPSPGPTPAPVTKPAVRPRSNPPSGEKGKGSAQPKKKAKVKQPTTTKALQKKAEDTFTKYSSAMHQVDGLLSKIFGGSDGRGADPRYKWAQVDDFGGQLRKMVEDHKEMMLSSEVFGPKVAGDVEEIEVDMDQVHVICTRSDEAENDLEAINMMAKQIRNMHEMASAMHDRLRLG